MKDPLAAVNKLGDSSILIAARLGDLPKLQQLLQNLQQDDRYQYSELSELKNLLSYHGNKLGKTVLHEAAQNSHLSIVNYLLDDLGLPSPDSLKQGDWTPLMLAATKDNPNTTAVIKKLLDTGADWSRVNKDGWNCFHIAARTGWLPNLQTIVDIARRRTPTSPSSPPPESVWLNSSKNGRTPLHTAVMSGHEATVRYVLSLPGVNSNCADSCGSTPVMEACRHGFISIIECLVQFGADLNECDILGRHSAHLAAEAGQLKVMEYLVRELSPVILEKKSVKTELTVAHFAAKGQINILGFLKSNRSDLLREPDGCFGRTPLHLAAIGHHAETVKYLLEHCLPITDINIEDTNGRKPSDYAFKPPVISVFQQFSTK